MLADNALTTLERAKLMLGLTEEDTGGTGDTGETEEGVKADKMTDEMVALLINRASALIERQIGRHLGRCQYHQWYDADGSQELVVEEYPIVNVDFVKEDGKLVDPRCYDYGQTGAIGVIYRDDGWLKAGYRRGLAYDIIASKRVIEVSYSAGYVLPKDATEDDPQTLPADLEGLVWDMVSQMYTSLQNGSRGLASFSISDVTWKFDKETPKSWMQVINLYRRYGIG